MTCIDNKSKICHNEWWGKIDRYELFDGVNSHVNDKFRMDEHEEIEKDLVVVKIEEIVKVIIDY